MHHLDVRILPPPDKHRTIFSRLAGLASGETLQIVNDHDPRPLRYHLESEFPDCFTWAYIESGPHVWRVDIQKIANLAAMDPEADLLADTQALSVSKITIRAGEPRDIRSVAAAAALIFCAGEGQLEISGRARQVCAGCVELVGPGESCTVTPSSDLTAYLVIAKEHR